MIPIDNLVTIIIDQIRFSGLPMDEKTFSYLYDEITESLKDYRGFEFYTRIDRKVKNPARVLRSENFQYFIEDNSIVLTNKFFN